MRAIAIGQTQLLGYNRFRFQVVAVDAPEQKICLKGQSNVWDMRGTTAFESLEADAQTRCPALVRFWM